MKKSTGIRIRLMCVDDHAIVRHGIASLLQGHKDVEIVASTASGEEATALFRRYRPDITLMDLQLPGISGIETIRAIRREFSDARIIVLSMYGGEEDVFNALAAGAATYLLKDTLSDNLVGVIRAVHAGEHPLPPEIEALLNARAAKPALTPREFEVLQLVASGLHNKEIAAALSISDETAHAHLKHIYAKLDVTDRAAAVREALRRGIVHLRP
jgi:DNA-binding NarL/FixJ family response regulator